MSDEAIIEAWCLAISHCYSLARGDRLGELEGKRPRLIDGRGLHPYSVEVGRVLALQDILPILEEADFNHHLLRREALEDAALEYELRTALRVGLNYGWITTGNADAILESQLGGHTWKSPDKGRGVGRSRR